MDEEEKIIQIAVNDIRTLFLTNKGRVLEWKYSMRNANRLQSSDHWELHDVTPPLK